MSKEQGAQKPWGKLMRKKIFGISLSAVLFAVSFPVQAQQAVKLPRIGFLTGGFPTVVNVEAFRQGLRELGYVEGKNIIIESRFAEGREDRLRQFASELVHL